MEKMSRNAPCHCGSGKKFKKCCLLEDTMHQEGNYSVYQQLVGKIGDETYSEKNKDEVAIAHTVFFGPRNNPADIDPNNEKSESFFNEWLFNDFDMDENVTFVGLFLEKNRHQLTEQEVSLCESLHESHRTIVKVLEVQPGKGILVQDVFSGQTRFINEYRGSYSMVKHDYLFVRIYRDNGMNHFGGMTILIDAYKIPELKALMEETAKIAFNKYGKGAGPVKWLLKHYGYLLIREVLALDAGKKTPKMLTTSGEPIVFCKMKYLVLDGEKVLDFLKNNFTEAESARPGPRPKTIFIKKDEKNTLLGSFILQKKFLTVETNSIKRSERFRKLLAKNCGSSLKLLKNTQKSLEEAFEEADDLPRKQGRIKPENLDDDAKEELFKTLYADWEKIPIPVLNDMTPLEAMKTEKGRELLKTLFELYENREERGKKDGRIDIGVADRLKRKMGFEE